MRRAAALLAALGVAAAQTGEDLSCLDVCGDTCQWDCGCLDADCRDACSQQPQHDRVQGLIDGCDLNNVNGYSPTRTAHCVDADATWSPEAGACYRYLEYGLDQVADGGACHAERLCNAAGGHLPSVHSIEEENGLWAAVNSYGVVGEGGHPLLYGLYRLTEDHSWAWADGSPVDYTQWSGEVSHVTGTRFAYSRGMPGPENGWLAMHEYSSATAVCQVGHYTTIDWNPYTPGAFANRMNGFVYSETYGTQAEAASYCESLGGGLASIHSAEEQAAVQSMVRNTAWLGGYTGGNGDWHWQDGTPWDFTHDHTDGLVGVDETALVIWADGQWHDYPATTPHAVVCRVPLSEITAEIPNSTGGAVGPAPAPSVEYSLVNGGDAPVMSLPEGLCRTCPPGIVATGHLLGSMLIVAFLCLVTWMWASHAAGNHHVYVEAFCLIPICGIASIAGGSLLIDKCGYIPGDDDGWAITYVVLGCVTFFFTFKQALDFAGTYPQHRQARKDARYQAAQQKEAEMVRMERTRPKYQSLVLARVPSTKEGLVVELSKPEDVAAELERFRIWKEAEGGKCPCCLGRGAVGKCGPRPGKGGQGKMPCGCKVCHLCHGTGTTAAMLQALEPPEHDDDKPCQICFCESRFKLAVGCGHFYCGDCIKGSLHAMMDTAQFPPYCPSCRAEAGGDTGKLADGPGAITDRTLTFLQRRGVIDKEFQFRFMLQAFKDRGEKFFRCPADGCGNWLLSKKPGDIIEVRGSKIVREPKIGLAPCGAAVCLVCHAELPRYVKPGSVGTKDPRVGDAVRAFLASPQRAPVKALGPAIPGNATQNQWAPATIEAIEAGGVSVKWDEARHVQTASVRWDDIEVPMPVARLAALHDCPEDSLSVEEMDDATLKELARTGKQCPVCSMWLQKNEGCDFMSCGTTAHGSLSDCIRNGGCGIAFKWTSGEVCDDPCGYKDMDGEKRGGRPVTVRQLPPFSHPKCPGCDRFKCVDAFGPGLAFHNKLGTQGKTGGGEHCCSECRAGKSTHGKYCHPIFKAEELAKSGVAETKEAEADEEPPPPPAPVLERNPSLVLPPGIKGCPACGILLEKIGGDDTMMCGCEAKPAGGTYRKAMNGGGCGHEFNFATLAPLGCGEPGLPFNERQVLFGRAKR